MVLEKYLKHIIPVLVILAVSFVVYSNSLKNDFVNYDDPGLVLENKKIKELSLESICKIFSEATESDYLPLKEISYIIDYHFWKLNPLGFHLTNVFLFMINCLVIYFLIFRIFEDAIFSLFTSLLFALHPIHAEAVDWVSSRKDVLSGAFFFMSLLFYIISTSPTNEIVAKNMIEGDLDIKVPRRNRPNPPLPPFNKGGKWGDLLTGLKTCFYSFSAVSAEAKGDFVSTPLKRLYYIFSIISFVLALFSKPSVIILPFLLPLFDYCFLAEKKKVRIEESIIRAIPFFVIAVISTAITLSVASEKEVVKTYWGDSPFLTLLAMLGVFFDYIKLLIFPINLNVRYEVVFPPLPYKYISGAVTLAVLLFTIFKFRKRNRLAVFCILWFLITLIPVSNIIPIAILKADRYLYLPSFAFTLGLGFFIFHQINNNREGRDKTSPYKQNQIAVQCRDNLYGCPRTGTSPVPTNPHYPPFATLPDGRQEGGDSLSPPLKKGEGGGFLSSFYKYLVCILFFLISLSYFLLTFNRNLVWKDGLTLWIDTIKKSPGDSLVHNNIGTMYIDKGNYQKAMTYIEEALRLDPFYWDAHFNLATIYNKRGEYDKAIEELKTVLDLKPNFFRAYVNLGNIYRETGYVDKAIEAYKKAMEIDKKSGDPHYNLALLLNSKGLVDDALKEYKEAIRLDPTLAKAYNNLGNIYFKKGLTREAISEYRNAVKQDTSFFEAYNNLGSALSEIGKKEEAIKFLKTAIKLKKDKFIPHFNLGKIYMDEREFDNAIREFKTVLKLEPDYYQAHVKLGFIFLNLGDKGKSVEHFNTALKINPNDKTVIELLKKIKKIY